MIYIYIYNFSFFKLLLRVIFKSRYIIISANGKSCIFSRAFKYIYRLLYIKIIYTIDIWIYIPLLKTGNTIPSNGASHYTGLAIKECPLGRSPGKRAVQIACKQASGAPQCWWQCVARVLQNRSMYGMKTFDKISSQIRL